MFNKCLKTSSNVTVDVKFAIRKFQNGINTLPELRQQFGTIRSEFINDSSTNGEGSNLNVSAVSVVQAQLILYTLQLGNHHQNIELQENN